MDMANTKLDLASICRICLEDGGVFPIFDSDSNMMLADKIMLCSPIQIAEGDPFPSRICTVCNSMLRIALDFRNKCELSDNTLRTYVSAKQEIDSKHDIEEQCRNVEYVHNNYDHDDNDMDYEPDYSYTLNHGDVDIKPKIEIIDEDDLPLLKFKIKGKLKKKSIIKKEKTRGKKVVSKKDQQKAKVTKTTNNIATSLLEGVFRWDGGLWKHVKRSKMSQDDKEEDDDSEDSPVVRLTSRILRAKQREIKKALKLKLKKEKTKLPTPTLCDHCGEQFNSKWRLTFHIRHKHLASKVILKCSFAGCKKTFNSNYYRSRHEKRIHSESKDYVCTQCGRQFAFKNELITHQKKHDPVKYPKKLRKCKYCPQTYKTQKSTDIHERSVHTGERPAICTICEAAFFHEDYLKEHTRLHTGETPFKCPICGRGYAQRGNMKSHLRIHKISELDEKTRLKMKPNYLKLLRD